jgi:hypothetical protein
MLTADWIFIVLLCLFGFIGICVICAEDKSEWSPDHKLIFTAVCIGLIVVIIFRAKTLPTAEDMPTTMMTDTEVDRLLDEVRTDEKTIYFDDEFQVLVYKYLLKYTREGKYETQNNPELDDILKKAREEIVHDKGRTTSPETND